MNTSNEHAAVLDTPQGIRYVHLAALKGACKLEKLGMRRSGSSARKVACQVLGLPPRTPVAVVIVRLQDAMDEALAIQRLAMLLEERGEAEL